jgi:hypothetical protein
MALTEEQKRKIEEEEAYRARVRSEITNKNDNDIADVITSKTEKKSNTIQFLWYVLLIILAVSIWYISIPVGLTWLFFKKSKLKKRDKIVVYSSVVILLLIIAGLVSYMNRKPEIIIKQPQENFSTLNNEAEIIGSVDPIKSSIQIGMESIPVQNGTFTYKPTLKSGANVFTFIAKNGFGESRKTINITRRLTEEEVEDLEAQQLIDETARKEAEEKALLEKQKEENAWKSSKAGKICTAHPEWGKEACEDLADNRVWVGMTYDMLVYERGNPNSINPSNYGNGTQYQYCWNYHTPRCFYDHNDDDILDAYN